MNVIIYMKVLIKGKEYKIMDLINVEKGMNGIKQTKVNCTQFVCPSTKK